MDNFDMEHEIGTEFETELDGSLALEDSSKDVSRGNRRDIDRKHKLKDINKFDNNRHRYTNSPYVKESSKGEKFVARPKSSESKQFHKKRSIKKIRKVDEIPARGNGANKVYDYKWNV